MATSNVQVAPTKTGLGKTLKVQGYILNESILRRIDNSAMQVISRAPNASSYTSKVLFEGTDKNGNTTVLRSYYDFLDFLNSETVELDRLVLAYELSTILKITVDFNHNGVVNVLAFGDFPDFEYNIERLFREVENVTQRYNWFIQKMVFTDALRRILIFASGLALLFGVLLAYTFYFALPTPKMQLIDAATEDIAQNLSIRSAIQSDSSIDKLNTLLVAQYYNALDDTRRLENIYYWLTRAVILFISLLILSLVIERFQRLYPKSLFALGKQKDAVSELKIQRDRWINGVALAFVVGIVYELSFSLSHNGTMSQL